MTKKAVITANAPILLVGDVEASARYYQQQVGFAIHGMWGEPANFCILGRDDGYLMLSQTDDAQAIRPHYRIVDNLWNAYFWVDDVDALCAELKSRGATIDYDLCDKPYGCREFGIQDLDGYDIAFGQEISD